MNPICFSYRLRALKHWLALAVFVFAGMTSAFAGDTLRLPPLTTVPHSPRVPGKFVWADLVTDVVPAVRTFGRETNSGSSLRICRFLLL